MNVTISYKQLDSSEAIDAKIREKTDKLEKYFDGQNINIKWTCSVDAGLFSSEAEVTGHRGPPLFASATEDNLYKTFDDVVQKISRQARKKLTRDNHKISEIQFVD